MKIQKVKAIFQEISNNYKVVNTVDEKNIYRYDGEYKNEESHARYLTDDSFSMMNIIADIASDVVSSFYELLNNRIDGDNLDTINSEHIYEMIENLANDYNVYTSDSIELLNNYGFDWAMTEYREEFGNDVEFSTGDLGQNVYRKLATEYFKNLLEALNIEIEF